MLAHPSRNFFRQLLLFGLFVWCVSYAVVLTDFDINSVEEANAVSWNYYGTSFSPNAISLIADLLDLSCVVGVIAMIFFRAWGRIVLIVRLFAECFLTPFMGLAISTGSFDMLAIISNTLIMVPLVLSLFPPCSDYFTQAEND